MARVRVLPELSLVGAIVFGAASALGATPAGQPAAPARHTPAVLRLVKPRPAALHFVFPRTWRPVRLEVRSPVKKPLRVFCAACPPGTVLEVDL